MVVVVSLLEPSHPGFFAPVAMPTMAMPTMAMPTMAMPTMAMMAMPTMAMPTMAMPPPTPSCLGLVLVSLAQLHFVFTLVSLAQLLIVEVPMLVQFHFASTPASHFCMIYHLDGRERRCTFACLQQGCGFLLLGVLFAFVMIDNLQQHRFCFHFHFSFFIVFIDHFHQCLTLVCISQRDRLLFLACDLRSLHLAILQRFRSAQPNVLYSRDVLRGGLGKHNARHDHHQPANPHGGHH